MSTQIFRWRVTLPDLRMVKVTAKNRYCAVLAAAQEWHMPWTSIARTVTVENLGEVENEG